MNNQIFEYPLNTKVRSYLRLEHINNQIEHAISHDFGIGLFQPLFGLYELCERVDYRNDLIKDLDKFTLHATKWQELPNIDQNKVAKLKEKLSHHKEKLMLPSTLNSTFQKDRFLSSIRQRLTVTGASCNFDLPQLHYWLAISPNERCARAKVWHSEFKSITGSIHCILDLIRQSEPYEDNIAKDGFYQQINHSPIAMIRVKIDPNSRCYPTISGHKNRFAIHMVEFDNQRHHVNDTKFSLACCSEP